MAKEKKKPELDKADVEKKILDVEDLIMQVAAFKGLTSYDVPEMLKHWQNIKSSLKYCIEDIINQKNDMPEPKSDETEYKRLDLKSKKKYSF